MWLVWLVWRGGALCGNCRATPVDGRPDFAVGELAQAPTPRGRVCSARRGAAVPNVLGQQRVYCRLAFSPVP